MSNEIILDTKLVSKIEGKFFVPSYQRGYRWGETEVERLLEDICSAKGESYCLQPIVVKKNGDYFELIDGQQRLTTIYLIYLYMNKESNHFLEAPKFTLSYETRDKSEQFLKEIDMSRKEENIDFWFICSAYESIQKWFDKQEDKKTTMTNVNKYFAENVKIIWYQVNQSEDANAMFTRLNIGKIPLTNAELVKAVFLSSCAEDDIGKKKQEEIAFQWDNIEKELQNNSFWFFLTNQTNVNYQTRIDIVLNLIFDTKDKTNTKDKYYTFFKFDKLRKDKTSSLDYIWLNIQKTFLTLKSWYENHELYHKIGYLIASEVSLQDIFNEFSKSNTKKDFNDYLKREIKKSIECGNYSELSYEKAQDRVNITKLLLLFNVESVRSNGENSQWFPFDKYKLNKNGKAVWSLEHIHAQNSEGLRTKNMWQEWLRMHIPSIQAVSNDTKLINRMENAIKNEKLEYKEFNEIQDKVTDLLSEKGNTEYIHSISNMALLNSGDNAALNNSTFDVKRNKIIEMDKKGKYIPFCTRMIFLKYYTPSKDNQLHFWGYKDRVAYIEHINLVLKDYLKEQIIIEKEDE